MKKVDQCTPNLKQVDQYYMLVTSASMFVFCALKPNVACLGDYLRMGKVRVTALLCFSFPSRGRRPVGERPLLRVSHSAVQSHPQLAGALPHEPQLCAHWQVVRQTL